MPGSVLQWTPRPGGVRRGSISSLAVAWSQDAGYDTNGNTLGANPRVGVVRSQARPRRPKRAMTVSIPRLSPRGADFFVTRREARLRVRDASPGRSARSCLGTYEKASDPRVSGDGRYLATALGGDPVVVLDLATGSRAGAHQFRNPGRRARPQSGRQSACRVDRGLVHVWDRSPGHRTVIKPDDLEHGRQPRSLVFSPMAAGWRRPHGATLAAAQPVSVWDVASGRRLGLMPCADGPSSCAGFAAHRIAP